MKFTIPKQVRVGGITYNVVLADEVCTPDGEQAYGVCDEDLGELRLSKRLNRTDDYIALTFFHELIHAMLRNVTYIPFLDEDVEPYEFTELLTDGLSRILLQVIRDN